jgi:hypothetical protein
MKTILKGGTQWHLYFDSGYHDADFDSRLDGQSVRPVQGFTE